MNEFVVVYPLRVLDQVVSQASVGQILHDQTQVSSAWGGGGLNKNIYKEMMTPILRYATFYSSQPGSSLRGGMSWIGYLKNLKTW